MLKTLKIFIFFIALILTNNANAKPVPPGAGEGDVPANILFLVDSSASMGRWIGTDGLGQSTGVALDSQDRILIGQNARRAIGGLLRYNTDGTRDRTFNIRRIPNAGCGTEVDSTRGIARQNLRKVSTVKFIQNLNGANTIFVNSRINRTRNYIFGFTEDGRTCRYAIAGPAGSRVNDFDIKVIGGTPYLFFSGSGFRNRSGYFKSCNLNTLRCELQNFGGQDITKFGSRISVNNEGTIFYISDSRNGHLVGLTLTQVGNAYNIGAEVRRCEDENSPSPRTQRMHATGVEVSLDDSNTIYISSGIQHAIQKLTLTDTTCTVVTGIGRGFRDIAKNIGTGTPATIDADDVKFDRPWGLNFVRSIANPGNTRILTASGRGYVDIFDEDLFTDADRDSAWLQNMGGPRVRRWDGVKQAIQAIVSDTTLTTGAHFGFGHWNAGENQGRRGSRGGRYCHTNNDCNYYGGWGGTSSAISSSVSQQTVTDEAGVETIIDVLNVSQENTGTAANQHPNGTSTICHVDGCLNVAVSPAGANQIMDVFTPLGMAWGTDANAFAQLAHHYFLDENAGGQLVNSEAECQLNYVIVIGDGAMRNTGVLGQAGSAAGLMERLRKKGVKSLYVAYGGGITGDNLQRFHELTRIGTSDAADATACAADDDCERAIVALTPEDLKTTLTAKIRQIIADRLAFTAPSITATIEEGGSLYQAQFSYEQFGEWKGTILRKSIDSKGEVTHTLTEADNWSAADELKTLSKKGTEADGRNLWSAIPSTNYGEGTPDNFNTDNADQIKVLFDYLGYTIPDYHKADGTSDCTTKGADAFWGDETNGIILFMKGNDYFNYSGDCGAIEEVREHVMGDIYHSQLIEVGPPEMTTNFSGTNEEAYWRAKNGYQSFMAANSNRDNIIYAGSNSGILHAIKAENGKEIWGFIPPFIAMQLPQIVNADYDGKVGENNTGGTNPIFGVDGSPVVHDIFTYGFTVGANGKPDPDESKSWQTVLFVPYGRGGPGFSVLQVTDPYKPVHMFSIYNDRIKSRVLVSDHLGDIRQYDYNSTSSSLLQSAEGDMAQANYNEAYEADGQDSFERQNAIAPCQSTTDFRDNGTNSCYRGSSFHFPEIDLGIDVGGTIPDGLLSAFEGSTPIPITSEIVDDGAGGGLLKVTFSSAKTFNVSPSEIEPSLSNQITITACLGASGTDPIGYDYSKLGETWSTPKIARIPSSTDSTLDKDKYVAILGAGMSKGDKCGGSALFLVDLESHGDGLPGLLHGAEANAGPIHIVDTSPRGLYFGTTKEETPNGSDITNAVPASPVVITPDTAPNIPWRGALVYINDLEGKITKINLSSNTQGFEDGKLIPDQTELYDQTTLFRLDANEANARYSYFSMDAGLGVSDGGFWLFGSTGNFIDLGNRSVDIDNILYGIQDKHYPYWKHLNNVTIPKPVSTSSTVTTGTAGTGGENIQINPEFIKKAHAGANDASSIDNRGTTDSCLNVTGNTGDIDCPIPEAKQAWVIHLEKDSGGNFYPIRTFRKASASPTLFKGKVYYPVYQPPIQDICNQGHAFICAADDECGTNNATELQLETPGDVQNPNANACAYVREGILSELVVFSDKLFANVAGPADDEDTLFSILSIPGDIITNKGGWRDSSF